MEEDSEVRLIDGVLRRDERAFRSLYQLHTPALYRLALSMTSGSEADAQDVIQETWYRAVRGLSGFERRSSLRTWLSSIAVRCALELKRREGREPRIPPESHASQSARSGAASRIDLERAFEQLAPGFREVLVLHDVQGYRHSDIAKLLGVTAGTSKSQLSRARKQMRKALGEDYAKR